MVPEFFVTFETFELYKVYQSWGHQLKGQIRLGRNCIWSKINQSSHNQLVKSIFGRVMIIVYIIE